MELSSPLSSQTKLREIRNRRFMADANTRTCPLIGGTKQTKQIQRLPHIISFYHFGKARHTHKAELRPTTRFISAAVQTPPLPKGVKRNHHPAR